MTALDLVPEPRNVLGMDGVEFIEFVTGKPQSLRSI